VLIVAVSTDCMGFYVSTMVIKISAFFVIQKESRRYVFVAFLSLFCHSEGILSSRDVKYDDEIPSE
jgi:hypothetical protein